MEFRKLGGSGLKVPVLSLGTGTFGGKGAFFIAQIEGRDGAAARPAPATPLLAGDGVVVVGRIGAEVSALFSAAAARPRAGRTTY